MYPAKKRGFAFEGKSIIMDRSEQIMTCIVTNTSDAFDGIT